MEEETSQVASGKGKPEAASKTGTKPNQQTKRRPPMHEQACCRSEEEKARHTRIIPKEKERKRGSRGAATRGHISPNGDHHGAPSLVTRDQRIVEMLGPPNGAATRVDSPEAKCQSLASGNVDVE